MMGLLNLNDKSFFFETKNVNLEKYLGPFFSTFNINDLKEVLIYFSITNKEIYLDPSKTAYFIEDFFRTVGVEVKYTEDPCLNLKTIKNSVEIKGSKNSHIRDGVSVCKFLFWLDEEIKKKKKLQNLQHRKNYLTLEKKINCFVVLVLKQFLALVQMAQLFITEFQKIQIKLLKRIICIYSIQALNI